MSGRRCQGPVCEPVVDRPPDKNLGMAQALWTGAEQSLII